MAGYLYLAIPGSAVAYALWFRGIRALPATSVAFLGLLSPVVATAAGWLILGQELTPGQVLGAVIVLTALVAGQTRDTGTALLVSTSQPGDDPHRGATTSSPSTLRPRSLGRSMSPTSPAVPCTPLLASRTSPRAFDAAAAFPGDQLDVLLVAARWAPSEFNSQPWRFLAGRRGEPAFDALLAALDPATGSGRATRWC